eukprot:786896-Prymnesium_polylepis.1
MTDTILAFGLEIEFSLMAAIGCDVRSGAADLLSIGGAMTPPPTSIAYRLIRTLSAPSCAALKWATVV